MFFYNMIKYILERCVNKVNEKIITNELINNFGIYLYEEEKSGNTIEKYMRDVRFFCKWLQDRALEKAAVIEYKRELCRSHAAKSVNSMLSSINTFFAFINRRDLMTKTLKIQRRIFADKSKELTKSEYERLLIAASDKKNERLYYLMQTMASTGLRVSEIKYVTCDAVKKGLAVISCKGKIREIFLPKKLCKMLSAYIKRQNIRSGPVFVSKTAGRLTAPTFGRCSRVCAKARASAKTRYFRIISDTFLQGRFTACKKTSFALPIFSDIHLSKLPVSIQWKAERSTESNCKSSACCCAEYIIKSNNPRPANNMCNCENT